MFEMSVILCSLYVLVYCLASLSFYIFYLLACICLLYLVLLYSTLVSHVVFKSTF